MKRGEHMAETHYILIVDDSEENLIYYSEVLDEHGYKFWLARDGKQAMETMRANSPDLVLLDIMMPRKSGVVVYRQMKRDPQLEKVPIIIITGASTVTGVDMTSGEEQPKDTYDDDLLRRYGFRLHEMLKEIKPDGYLDKPIEPDGLIAKIKECLK